MKKWNLISGFFIVAIVASCQYDPYANEYTTLEPKGVELVGTYVFEGQTADYELTEFKDSEKKKMVVAKININSDGTYSVVNLPVFGTWDAKFVGLVTKSGKWAKTTVGSIGDGSGKVKMHWGIDLAGLPNEVQSAGLMNNEPPYKIIFGFGDPDSGQAMIFKKE